MTLEAPVVVSQAAPGVNKWGQWQFPTNISRMRDGGIALVYSVGQDSAAGMAFAYTVSYDEGSTWRDVDAFPSPNGLRLPNGDMLRTTYPLGLDAAWLELPSPDMRWRQGVVEYDMYLPEDIPHELRGIRLERCPSGEDRFRAERHRVETPGEYMTVTRDDMSVHPFGTAGDYLNPQSAHRLRLGPDGRVWMIAYRHMKRGGEPLHEVSFHVSTDNGRTFSYRSHIPFDDSLKVDTETWYLRRHNPIYLAYEGFNETDIAFMPDGSIVCFMRSGSYLPMFTARSTDGGCTWSVPEPFDDFGIVPAMAQFENGATVLVYGRPGVHLRAACDPEGRKWGDRVEIIPCERQDGASNPTCANSGILALNANTALVTYSDFEYPNPDGVPVKTILARKVHTEIV